VNHFQVVLSQEPALTMPFIKVYIHFVWSTKNREPFLATRDLRLKTWEHIRANAEAKNIYIDSVNGYSDHCHCLVSLAIKQTMSKILQLIKGESSYWINKENLCQKKFEWQDEYFAVSVSESKLNSVRNYIKNQEEHHRIKTFQEEYSELMRRFGSQFSSSS
jgi:putative transposase